MAVTFVGSATAGGNAEPITLTWPGGLAANQVALVFWTFQSPGTPTAPSGFTQVTFNAGGSGSMLTYIYSKVLAGSESGSLTLTCGFGANRQSACLVIYSGVDTVTPVDGTPAVDTTGVLGTTHNNPAYTPTVANCVILTSIHERASSIDADWTKPTGYTERADTLLLAFGSGGTITAVADDLADGRDTSAVTPDVWTGDNGTGTPNIVTYTLALRSAAAPPGAPTSIPPHLLLLLAASNQATWLGGVSASLDAPADFAAGTGTADNPAVDIQVNADQATGTGSAQDPLPSIGPNADQATGTGSSLDGAASLGVNAGVGSGAGSSLDATVATGISANAEAATGTGSSLDASTAVTANADVATGTGSALAATVLIGVEALAELATATGTALITSVALGVMAGVAEATGTADDPTTLLTGRTLRPFTGTTSRPSTGSTVRPNTGITYRP